MVEHRVGWLDPVFVGLSVVGYAGLVWVGLALALARWTQRSVRGLAVATAASVWATELVTSLLKRLIDRPRPFETLAEADPLLGGAVGDSMPSGHASTSFAGAVLLAVLIRRAVPALLLLAALIAFSRVYVGVHYPLDVLAGAALGVAVGLAVAVGLTARRPLSPARRVSEARPPPG